MNWIGKHSKKAIFAVLAVLLIGYLGVNALEKNKTASTSQLQGWSLEKQIPSLCDYAITDYEKIKPEILALFPVGMSEKQLRKQLAVFPLEEIRGEKIIELPIPKIENGKYVFMNNEVVMSKAKLIGIFVKCDLPYKNVNRWNLVFYVDGTGKLLEKEFNVTIDDENFAKRNIELKAEYVSSEDVIAKVIHSLAASRFLDWGSLSEYLRFSGFDVSDNIAKKTANIARYRVEKKPNLDQLGAQYFASEGLLAIVWVDQSGKVLQVD